MKSAEPARSAARVTARFVSVGATAGAALAVLSGCALFGPSGDTPTPAAPASTAAGSKSVRQVLAAVKPLAAKDKQPTAKAFFAAMTRAGFKKSSLEFSLDTTPLDTGVPAKVFGVRVADGCVIGEVRDGKASAQLAKPTASTGSCLLGKVQRPGGVPQPSGSPRPADQTGPTGLPGEEGGSGESGESGESGSGGEMRGH